MQHLPRRRQAQLKRLREILETMAGRVRQVVRQTKARVFQGITQYPHKIVSLFEPHTEIIRKGKASKPNEFGKLVQVQEAENQIITHYEVFAERPSDRDLLVPAVEEHRRRFGRVPEMVAGDAGFYSFQNEKSHNSHGSEVCFGAEPLDQQCRSPEIPEAALVPRWAKVEDRVRGPHQRIEATARTESLSLPRVRRYAAVGWSRSGGRQCHPDSGVV
jgi:hypothetical protein